MMLLLGQYKNHPRLTMRSRKYPWIMQRTTMIDSISIPNIYEGWRQTTH